jgi:hypothetical protein
MVCVRIREFESFIPSQAVRLFPVISADGKAMDRCRSAATTAHLVRLRATYAMSDVRR